MNNFCCSLFADHINAAGTRGFSIIPFEKSRDSNEYVFFLQCRNIDEEDCVSRLFVVDVSIKFCPWCGTNLTIVAKLNNSIISEIAKRKSHLIKI
jgi:hypothetical protein